MPFGGLLTLGIIGGATSLIGAGIQSHQAGKAVDAQVASGDKALALQKDIYNSQVQNLAPFRNAGVGAVSALPAFLGLNLAGLGSGGVGAGVGGGGDGGGAAPLGVTGPSGPGLTMGAISDPSKNGGFAGQAPGTTTLGSTSYTPNQQAPGYGPQSNPIPQLRGQTPDGRVVLVPAEKASEFQNNGGKILGQG